MLGDFLHNGGSECGFCKCYCFTVDVRGECKECMGFNDWDLKVEKLLQWIE